MSRITFQNRLQALKTSGRYSQKAIKQFESIASIHGKLPKVFILKDLGVHTISSMLNDLGYNSFSIYAPTRLPSSIREVILH